MGMKTNGGDVMELRLSAWSPTAAIIGAALCVSGCAVSPDPVEPTSWSFLTTEADCTKLKRIAPAQGQAGGDQTAIADLARACGREANDPDAQARLIDMALAAFNTSQLYAALAEREGRTSDWARVEEFATLSRSRLRDDSTGLEGSNTPQGEANDHFKFTRLILLIRAQLEQGLDGAGSASGQCGSAAACLQKGLRLYDENQRTLATSSARFTDRDTRTRFSELQIVRARADAAASTGSAYGGGFERAIQTLEAVIAREQSETSASAQGLASSARTTLIDIAETQAAVAITGRRNEAQLTQAIGLLRQAERAAEGGQASADRRASLQIMLGDAHAILADLLASRSRSAERASNLCDATEAYRTATDLGAVQLTDRERVKAFIGEGLAYAALAQVPDATCRGAASTRLQVEALRAFDQGWDDGAGASDFGGDPARAYAALLLGAKPTPRRADAIKVTATAGAGWGDDAMELLLEFAGTETDQATKIEYYNRAVAAAPTSPLPDFKHADYLYRSGTLDQTGKIEALLAAAAAKADRSSVHTALGAKIYDLRSRNETRKLGRILQVSSAANAVEWAEKAAQRDANLEFKFQACRAHFMQRSRAFGQGEAFCSANPYSAEGALLAAMGELRKSQIARVADGGLLSTFRSAERQFRDVRQLSVDEARRTGRSVIVDWPALDASQSIEAMARFGEALAYACSVRSDEAVPPLDSDLESLKSVFAKYGFSECGSLR